MSNEKANGNGDGGSASTANVVPEYVQNLGFFDLFCIAVGVIIGSGIMTMTTRAIGMTGRSVVLAFMMASVYVIATSIPTILLTSCIRLIGGAYTQFSLFVSARLAGLWFAISLTSQMGHNLYAMTFSTYFADLVGRTGDNTFMRITSAILVTAFYAVNFFGVDAMAKLQNAMTVLLLVTLAYFTIRGLPQVDFANYFGGEGWMTGGSSGLFRAATLLVYSLTGGTSLMPYSPNAKNARRDVPLAAVISTLGVAVLYTCMGFVCAGVIPLDQIYYYTDAGVLVGRNLTVICRAFMSNAEVAFFIIGGALMAAATTLNGVIGSVTRSAVMMSIDGWLPKGMATIHPKYNTAWKWQIFYYCMTMMPIIFNLNISQVTNVTLLGSYLSSFFNIAGLFKLPKMFPEQWSAPCSKSR